MQGEISELRELISVLQKDQREEEQKRIQVEKEVEELKKIITSMRENEDGKEKEITELKEINKRLREDVEMSYKDEFDRGMRHF